MKNFLSLFPFWSLQKFFVDKNRKPATRLKLNAFENVLRLLAKLNVTEKTTINDNRYIYP